MPDIDTFMSVDAGDIDTILGVDSGDIDTVMGVTLVTALQAYEGQTFLVTGGNTDPFANSTHVEAIQKKTSTSNGDSSAFGDMMSGNIREHAATGGGGRGIVSAGGNSPLSTGADNANIHYVTIASDGNATDTSDDVAITQEGNQGAGNGVKMGISGGFDGDLSGNARWIDDMQIYTISGGSDASDVGDLDYLGGYNVYGGTSSTRWIIAGGRNPDSPQEGYSKAINYMTWSSEGNATDAGELIYGRDHGKCTVSSESRIVFGSSSSKQPDGSGGFNDIRDHMMEYVNPASTDDAADFGDDVGDDGSDDSDSATNGRMSNFQDGTRGEFWGGSAVSGNSAGNETDSISYITIASTAGSADSTDAGNYALHDTGLSNAAGLSGT
jgi:hypothetical protein